MARQTRSKRAAGPARSAAGRGRRDSPDHEPADGAPPHDAVDESSGDRADRERAPLASGLYLAATPIGSSGDVTLSALDALARADVIAAEDTRRAAKLMAIHGVARRGRPVIPYHDHNGPAQRPRILAWMAEGKSVVYVSDAGTPLVADPGWRLAREAIDAGLRVVALPGASAVLAALSVSGLPTDRFFFAGFTAPKAAARRRDLSSLAAVPATLVFYESPRRLAGLLADMADAFGGERDAAVSRELTKRHEETVRGPLVELARRFDGPPPKGEIVVCVAPPGAASADPAALDDALREALGAASLADAARAVAEAFGAPRRVVYARALEIAAEQDDEKSETPGAGDTGGGVD